MNIFKYFLFRAIEGAFVLDKRVDDFIFYEQSVAKQWLISEILKNSDLTIEHRDLLDFFIPIMKKFLSEIHQKLKDTDFTKKELSELYFKEATLKSDLITELKSKINRELKTGEKSIIDNIIKYFEDLIIETWFAF